MLTIRVKSTADALRRHLDDVAARQLPFATARALTATAKTVQSAWTTRLAAALDRPTPFTLRAFAVEGARKDRPVARVYARPIQGAYLAPEEFGLAQVVAKVAVLRPVDVPLNQYGNIPRGALARLKAGNAFIGRVTLRNGEVVAGIWRRLPPRQAKAKGRAIELLVRFAAPVVVKTRLGLLAEGERLVRAELPAELARQLERALMTAR